MSPHRECQSWDDMSGQARALIAREAGFANQHTQARMSRSLWFQLDDSERTNLYRVDWSKTLSEFEQKRRTA